MNPLAKYIPIVELLTGLAIIAGITWGVHEFLNHERQLGYDKAVAEYTEKLQEAKDAAAKREQELRAERDAAIEQGASREQTIRTLAAASGSASNSLHDALKNIGNGVPGVTIETLRNTTATLTTLLDECQARYRELAEKADRHANDAKTCSDAWPQPIK